jgi:hypothetical protein
VIKFDACAGFSIYTLAAKIKHICLGVVTEEPTEKKGLIEQKKALDKIILDVQTYIDFGAGLLEKGFHTFIWIRPQATFTLMIALILSEFEHFSWKQRFYKY